MGERGERERERERRKKKKKPVSIQSIVQSLKNLSINDVLYKKTPMWDLRHGRSNRQTITHALLNFSRHTTKIITHTQPPPLFWWHFIWRPLCWQNIYESLNKRYFWMEWYTSVIFFLSSCHITFQWVANQTCRPTKCPTVNWTKSTLLISYT